ncbi:MAG: hypothetical protein ACP5RH_22205, partial [Leptodesmis sp.]|uniref:hypothetical protein n=1 Tax=Leptodesmis sp. TaxID=3100501 RepID=UPI003D14912A
WSGFLKNRSFVAFSVFPVIYLYKQFLTLSKYRTSSDIDRPFRQINALTSDQANHHPDQGLAVAVVCPRERLTQERLQLMM